MSFTEGDEVNYNKPDYTKIPFTIEALGSGNITWQLGSSTVKYSKNRGSWETMDGETSIAVVEGDKIQFKGTNTSYNSKTISSTAWFNVKGNIMSLVNENSFTSEDSVGRQAFKNLFNNNTNLVSARYLKLPATTLSYECYSNMFYDCTSLTTAPELPAETLAYGCYNYMFSGCTSLSYIKAMFTTTPATDYTQSWVKNVAANGTFVKNTYAAWNVTSVHGIPVGWRIETASS